MNARFWELLHGSPVKITLRPGERRQWHSSQPTDEGWSGEWCIWEHEGDEIHRESGTDGVDCDGRLATFYECACPLNLLRWGGCLHVDDKPMRFPEWHKIEQSRRDYAAEAMGY